MIKKGKKQPPARFVSSHDKRMGKSELEERVERDKKHRNGGKDTNARGRDTNRVLILHQQPDRGYGIIQSGSAVTL